MYSSTLPSTSALDGVGGQHHAPAALPPGKTRYPLYRRLGGPQSWSGRVWKISPPPGFDPRTVQPVASRYIDWAIRAHIPLYTNIMPCYTYAVYIYYVRISVKSAFVRTTKSTVYLHNALCNTTIYSRDSCINWRKLPCKMSHFFTIL